MALTADERQTSDDAIHRAILTVLHDRLVATGHATSISVERSPVAMDQFYEPRQLTLIVITQMNDGQVIKGTQVVPIGDESDDFQPEPYADGMAKAIREIIKRKSVRH